MIHYFHDIKYLRAARRALDVYCLVVLRGGRSYENKWMCQGYNASKVNCSCVYSAYILKPLLSGRNL